MFGKVGYIGKGIAIAIVGGLILYGGITHDASKSGNLDQALHKVLTYPFGQFLLVSSPPASSATGSSASRVPGT